jgi:hypothetical protein
VHFSLCEHDCSTVIVGDCRIQTRVQILVLEKKGSLSGSPKNMDYESAYEEQARMYEASIRADPWGYLPMYWGGPSSAPGFECFFLVAIPPERNFPGWPRFFKKL